MKLTFKNFRIFTNSLKEKERKEARKLKKEEEKEARKKFLKKIFSYCLYTKRQYKSFQKRFYIFCKIKNIFNFTETEKKYIRKALNI